MIKRNGLNVFILPGASDGLKEIGFRGVPIGDEKFLYYNPKLFDLVTEHGMGVIGLRIKWEKMYNLLAQLEPDYVPPASESGPPDHIGGEHV